MIKILVLDDNPKKSQEISKNLLKINGVEEENIYVATDIISAKKFLLEDEFDILLLDIQIPNRFDQPAKVDGGLNLWKELKQSKRYNIPLNIIAVTAYDNTFTEVQEIFNNELLSIVKYEETSNEWADKICRNVERILLTKSTNNIIEEVDYNYDVAIICALSKVELESIKRLSEVWEKIDYYGDSTVYYSSVFKREDKEIKVITASSPQMGMTAAAVLSMKLIQNFRPRYLVMSGIAAGVSSSDVKLGDVLIADPSWDYGSGKEKKIKDEVTLSPDPNPIRIDCDISEKFKLLSEDMLLLEKIKSRFSGDKPNTSLDIHVGPLASGAAVLAHSSIIDSIKQHSRKLIGIDMETYGVLYAANHCTKPRPIAFSIKSVCDFADSKKNDNYQNYAAHTSANVLYEFLFSIQY